MKLRYAVITGASQGIGESLARNLASRGYSLILAARSSSRLSQVSQELIKSYGIAAHPVECDLSQASGVEKLIGFCQPYISEIEVLINNAGFGYLGEFLNSEWELQEQMLDLNIKTVTRLTHFFGLLFKTKHTGFILNVASTAAFQPDPYFSVYGATKAYVLSFSEALREELSSSGVQVSVLCPGPTNTPFHSRAGTDRSPFIMRFMASVDSVAQAGVSGLFSKKTVIVPGLLNRFLVFVTRFVPRANVARLASLMLRTR